MKPVACQVQGFPGENPGLREDFARGKIPVAREDFGTHVLVVDDEPLIRWSVAESLSELGFDVEQAGDAASALRLVTNAGRPFRTVVLDLRLPDMCDLSLLGTLRQLLPDARLILMTAFGAGDVLAEAESLGATVLNKPFELEVLTRAVLGPRH
ncbi:MAG: sporulation initiation phosphotransferase [Acidobacteriota bacterium]|jgi:DNA-binding NtrC family response regulator